LNFEKASPKKGGRKKKKGSDSEDDMSGSDLDSDKEVSFSTSPAVTPRTTSRRAAGEWMLYDFYLSRRGPQSDLKLVLRNLIG
jgi:hypothetical protein